jgi:hypothetical protein
MYKFWFDVTSPCMRIPKYPRSWIFVGSKMKVLARSYCFWKNIGNDIEQMVKSCKNCCSIQNNVSKPQLHPWEFPSKPRERLHVDYAGRSCTQNGPKLFQLNLQVQRPATTFCATYFLDLGYLIFLSAITVLSSNHQSSKNCSNQTAFTINVLHCIFQNLTAKQKDNKNKPMARQSLREVSQFVD